MNSIERQYREIHRGSFLKDIDYQRRDKDHKIGEKENKEGSMSFIKKYYVFSN